MPIAQAMESPPNFSPNMVQFTTLPVEIIVEIFMHLGIADVQAMGQVCRSMYAMANWRPVWVNLSFGLLSRSRPLPLKGFTLPDELSTDDLRKSVLRASALERNWTSEHPQPTTPLKTIRVDFASVGDGVARVWRITSNYIVVATELGDVLCWDIEEDKFVGSYTLGNRWIVFNCRADYVDRRVYCISGVYPVVGDMKFSLLQVQFPRDPATSPEVEFTELARFSLPYSHVLDLYILDPSRRLVCVLFMFPETNTIGLYALFDWKSGLSIIIDTEIRYSISNVTATSLSPDGEHIMVFNESWDAEGRMSYSIAELREHATRQIKGRAFPTPERMGETALRWKDEDAPCADLTPMGSYFFRQWWPTYSRVPVRSSTAVIYTSTATSIWRIAQHFSGAHGPCGAVRYVAAMAEPVLVQQEDGFMQPLLDVDFSHAVWVESAENDLENMRRMRLATFDRVTDKGERVVEKGLALATSIRTLEVDMAILDIATHLVIDQSQGSIMISTLDGELHILQYS